MIHASESCAMLIPLALAIFSTLFFFIRVIYIMINHLSQKINLRVDDCFRSCILAVAFDGSEEEKANVKGKCDPLRSMSIPITLRTDRIISIRTRKKTAGKRGPRNRTNAKVLKICFLKKVKIA